MRKRGVLTVHSYATERQPRKKMVFGIFLSLMVLLGFAVSAPTPAHAATDMQIDNVYFDSDAFADGTRQSLHVDWSLPDGASAPATLVLDLPESLRGYTDTFDMIGPDGHTKAGECSVSQTQVRCEVSPQFIQDNPYSVSGQFWFDVQSNLKNKEDRKETFRFGEFTQDILVEANQNWCSDNCTYTDLTFSKYGTYYNTDDTIIWSVRLPAGEQGIEAGQEIVVNDVLDENVFELVVDDTYPRVREGKQVSFNEWERETPDYSTKDASEVVWTNNHLTATFTSVAGNGKDTDLGEGVRGIDGSFYIVQWKVRVLDQGKAGTYQNSANYTIAGDPGGSKTGTAKRYSGGANVVGENFGKFQVTKELTGDTVLNPTFTVNYDVYDDTVDPTVPQTSGSFELKSGQSFLSQEYFKGTRIVFTEVQPTEPSNVTWETPVFLDAAGEPLTELSFSTDNDNLGQITEIRLVNEANLITRPLTARKVVENPDGVETGVDSFRIGYAREAAVDKGIQNLVGGQIVLPADGTEVSVDLPAGVGYSFFEWFTSAPQGTTWADPVYTINGVDYTEDELYTLELDGKIDLVVTNTITKNVGGFSISKTVSGEGASLVPEGTEFEVTYSYSAVNQFEAGTDTVTVVAGGPAVEVADIAEGAVVKLEEVTAVNPEGGTYGTPQFSLDEFTVVNGEIVEIALDNPVTWNSGNFSVVKEIEGSGASLVGDDVAFEVDYRYTLPEELDATPNTGTGTLTVLNNGVAVPSEELPYGTEVTLSEATPPAVTGGTWGEASFDHPTFMIGDESTFEVTLTNTITSTSGELSNTGGANNAVIFIPAAILLLGGVAAVAYGVRKRRINQ